jgi:O-antigen/teichoic acid export membrane protein
VTANTAPDRTGTPLPAPERRVLKNTALLILAQVAGTPISVLINVLLARFLGPSDFGNLYLSLTFSSFGFLVVDWGQSLLLSGEVARDRGQAARLLGSALVWRAATSVLVYLAVALVARALGYSLELQQALALVFLGAAFTALSGACHDVIRGFERTDIAAASIVGWQLLNGMLTVPVLLWGGGLRAVLLAQAGCSLVSLLVVLLMLRPLKIWPLQPRRETSRLLLVKGTPFVFFALAVALQPNVDAIFLSKLASSSAVGWYAAANKLVGVLVYPANALIVALYPTLCRLHSEDRDEYRRLTRNALSNTTVLVVPVALGCFLFPELGIRLFSRDSFGPAEDNLRVLSLLLLLTYFSMPISSSLVAAGRQRPWAIVQLSCVVVSLIADPWLIPWFQVHYDNGGLGVCVAAVLSEVLMISAGLALLPRGIIDRGLGRRLLLAACAGVAMLATAHSLRGISPWLNAPLSVLVYAVCLWGIGGIDATQVAAVRDLVRRRLAGIGRRRGR